MRELTPQSVQILREIWYDIHDIKPKTASTEIFAEGERKIRVHFQRERNKALVSIAKQRFKEKHGRLFCEICCFDFTEVYGEMGEDFIEAHHKQALSESNKDAVETSPNDLAMVCPNCHRMLHRRKPWLTVEELRIIIKKSDC